MNTITQKPINTKLFVCCQVTSDLYLHLNKSKLWKREHSVPSPDTLLEIQHLNKTYIGLYAPTEKATLLELRELEKTILQKLQLYTPDLSLNNFSVTIFSQLFIP